jgi:hypothetical protein
MALLFGGGAITEVYDAKSGHFEPAGVMPEIAGYATGTVLNDGRALIFASIPGIDLKKHFVPLPEIAKAEMTWHAYIYDPNRKEFSPGPTQSIEVKPPQPVAIDSTKVLILGIVLPDYDDVLSSEIYD